MKEATPAATTSGLSDSPLPRRLSETFDSDNALPYISIASVHGHSIIHEIWTILRYICNRPTHIRSSWFSFGYCFEAPLTWLVVTMVYKKPEIWNLPPWSGIQVTVTSSRRSFSFLTLMELVTIQARHTRRSEIRFRKSEWNWECPQKEYDAAMTNFELGHQHDGYFTGVKVQTSGHCSPSPAIYIV